MIKQIFKLFFLTVIIGFGDAQTATQDEGHRIMIGCGQNNYLEPGTIFHARFTPLLPGDYSIDLDDQLAPHLIANCWGNDLPLPRGVDAVRFEHVGTKLPINWYNYWRQLLQNPQDAVPELALNKLSEPTEAVFPITNDPKTVFSGQPTNALQNYYNALKPGGEFVYMSQRTYCPSMHFDIAISDLSLTAQQKEAFHQYIYSNLGETPILKSLSVEQFYCHLRFLPNPYSDFSLTENNLEIRGVFWEVQKDAYTRLLTSVGFQDIRISYEFEEGQLNRFVLRIEAKKPEAAS